MNHPIKFLLFSLLSLFFTSQILAQNTIGVTFSSDDALEGYTFFSPFSSRRAYLVDPCGRLVNTWDRGTFPGLSAYLLENGLMLRTVELDPRGPFTSASNAGAIELVDWDNNTVWFYEINTLTELSHHDVVAMPNGNILTLVWEITLADEVIELGRDPNEIAVQGFMWAEKILELEPIGFDSARIVWQWELKDRYIQDFDSTKSNYAVIADHPERFDINLPEITSSNSNATRDWHHINAIDYHPELDQILLSVRNSDEIWIIDHSTTTAEAAGHTGGRYGKGGDILYRWGNANAYQRGLAEEQQLFGQHGVHWIRDGSADDGKILLFNNGNGRPGPDYSTAEILVPPQDSAGGYVFPTGREPFGPSMPEWSYGEQSSERLYSPFLSNAQRLSNGNTLLNYGSLGTLVEVDNLRNVVWRYVIPLNRDTPISQGNFTNVNATFRAYKFPADYAGFSGIDLSAGEPIERNPDLSGCEMTTSSADLPEASLQIQQLGWEQLQVDNPQQVKGRLQIVNLAGIVLNEEVLGDQVTQQFSLPPLASGIYFARILTTQGISATAKIWYP